MRWILTALLMVGCGSPVDEDGDGFSPPEDCCDLDVRAFPGQLMYFTTPINNLNSFDFDCNGSDDLEFPDLHECSTATGVCDERPVGWGGKVPECGEIGDWVVVCGDGTPPCYPRTEQKIQACR